MAEPRAEQPSPDALVALCWDAEAGGGVHRHPLSRRQAEALADALSRSFPGRKCWVEELPPIPPQGRLHRPRRGGEGH
jgi:hypothetical protein